MVHVCTPPCTPVPVAIYSLSHSSIGRSTHGPGTAGAHVGYITRSGACDQVMHARMPGAQPGQRGGEARAWLDQVEAGDRKNGRVIDKVMLAIPRELDRHQAAQLVRSFAEEVTRGRAPWLAAMHDLDSGNPHAHLVIRDKDLESGKRVVGLSEKGSTEQLREAWERHANAALEAAGHAARIDRRSLKAQGIERAAGLHVGPRANAITVRGKRPISQARTVRVFRRGKPGSRIVDYRKIDGRDGRRTRYQENALRPVRHLIRPKPPLPPRVTPPPLDGPYKRPGEVLRDLATRASTTTVSAAAIASDTAQQALDALDASTRDAHTKRTKTVKDRKRRRRRDEYER